MSALRARRRTDAGTRAALAVVQTGPVLVLVLSWSS